MREIVGNLICCRVGQTFKQILVNIFQLWEGQICLRNVILWSYVKEIFLKKEKARRRRPIILIFKCLVRSAWEICYDRAKDESFPEQFLASYPLLIIIVPWMKQCHQLLLHAPQVEKQLVGVDVWGVSCYCIHKNLTNVFFHFLFLSKMWIFSLGENYWESQKEPQLYMWPSDGHIVFSSELKFRMQFVLF